MSDKLIYNSLKSKFSARFASTTRDFDKKMIDALSDKKKKNAYKKYRKEFYQASNFRKRYDYPIHVDIELSNICNYRCLFCEHGKTYKNKKEYYKRTFSLPKDKVFNILDECADIGVKSVQFNIINEPLLYADLIDVITYARSLEFSDIFFITNASLLDSEISAKLAGVGLTKIMFSIDAFSEAVYRVMRNRKSSYRKVVENILEFIDIRNKAGLKLPLTRVCFVATEKNKHEIDDFVKFWQSKVDSVLIQNLINLKDKKLLNKRSADNLKDYRCNKPYFRLSVKADGRVNPCCAFYGNDITIGNIYENSLADIWKFSFLKSFQEMHKKRQWYKNDICRKCVISTAFPGK